MNRIKGHYKDQEIDLYKIQNYNVLRLIKGCEAITFSDFDAWIGYCARDGAYVIYVNDKESIIEYADRCDYDMTSLTFINKYLNITTCLCYSYNSSTITFDLPECRWKICIHRNQPRPVRNKLHDIWHVAAGEWIKEETPGSVALLDHGGTSLNRERLCLPPVPFSCYQDIMRKYWTNSLPEIKDVIFNAPATIVFWEDGSKTVVKAQDEDFDPEKGLAMAISKKALGNEGRYYETIKKWMMTAKIGR